MGGWWPGVKAGALVACHGLAILSRSRQLGRVKTVLFACVHNAGRSQIAAALFNALADPAKARAISAGTEPAEHVHPQVVAALNERGLEVGVVRPRMLTPEITSGVAWVAPMGCGESCPVVPGARGEDWPVEDPGGLPLPRVRVIRDEIEARVRTLRTRLGCRAPA